MNLQPSCFVARKFYIISLDLTSRNKDEDTMERTEIIINEFIFLRVI